MGIWKKILIGFGIIILLILLAAGIFEIYLYTQGKTYAVQIPVIGYIIPFGKVPEDSFPASLGDSYKKVVRGGEIVLYPKYVDDAIVDSELNGDLVAHDIRTGERKLYYWQDETAYVCIESNRLGTAVEYKGFVLADPKNALSNYGFYFFEYGKRGDDLLSGLSHFETDVAPGMPIKLLLKNRTKNADGAFDLVGIFLFTDKTCSTYPV